MSNKFEEPEWSKEASKEFAKEYCEQVDKAFVEAIDYYYNILGEPDKINIKQCLQQCIDNASQSYGFKVNE
jgi:hypothetical protein